MQANDFFNAYLVLKDNNEALFERLQNNPGKPLIGTKEQGARITGGVEIVCLAFSVELYIKDLYYALNVKVPSSHNILELFEKLPEQTRNKIFAYDAISQNSFFTRGDIFSTKRFTSEYSAYDRFIEQIKAISDGFTRWRYAYESAALHYDTSFALAFIESLKSASSSERKSQN